MCLAKTLLTLVKHLKSKSIPFHSTNNFAISAKRYD